MPKILACFVAILFCVRCIHEGHDTSCDNVLRNLMNEMSVSSRDSIRMDMADQSRALVNNQA